MQTILSILEHLVSAEHGPAGLAKIHALDPEHHLRGKGVPSVEQVKTFMSGLAALRTTPEGEAYYWAGEGSVPQLLRALPQIRRKYNTLLFLLMHVNELASKDLQAMVPDADIPYFDVELLPGDSIRLGFTGSVEARELVEGLIMGFARAYEERVGLFSPLANSARPDRRVTDIKFDDERRAASRATPPAGKTPTTKTPPKAR